MTFNRCLQFVAMALGSALAVVHAHDDVRNGSQAERDMDRFHVYLLMGQSNMAGRGKMLAADQNPVDRVFALDADDRWKPASHPLHFDKPEIAGYGLGIDFAKTILEQNASIEIGLVPCAFGGTSLDQWQKGKELYARTIRRASVAKGCGTIKGVLWHQGESDCNQKAAASYCRRLSALMEDLQADLGLGELPIVVGEIGRFRSDVNHCNLVNNQLHQFARQADLVKCVSSEGLNHNGDSAHFDSRSLRVFGLRYAKAMIQIHETERKGNRTAKDDPGSGNEMDKSLSSDK